MMDSWNKLRLLGKGTYGEVFLASPANKNGTLIAVKSAYVEDVERYKSLKEEESFLKQLNGEPYVVRCFGRDESEENGEQTYNLLLEYASRGTLTGLIWYSPKMDATQVAYYARMLLTALSRIHAHGIAHCDLKPDNILVFRTNGRPDELKIADFGQAVWVSSPVEPYQCEENYWNRGAIVYASPESVARGEHGTCTDIWSLGVILAEMMNPDQYFFDDNDKGVSLYDQIVHQPLELEKRVPVSFDEYAVDFLEKCLDRNPTNRWSAQELLNHPFITKDRNGTSRYSFDDGQIKAENPIDPSIEWVSAYGLFTDRTGEYEGLLQPLYDDLFTDMLTDEELLRPLYDLFTDMIISEELQPLRSFDRQIKAENPIEGSGEWVSASDLFTTDEELQPLYDDYFTDMADEELQPLYDDYFTDMADEELHPRMVILDEILCRS